MKRFELKIFADYFQFYLQDETAKGDLSESWTAEAVNRHLAIAPGTIGVGTVRDTHVPVVVEIVDQVPDLYLSDWDQVNECTIEVSSGRIVIAGCTDYFPDALRIDVPPGSYRARVCYGQLNSVAANGLEGDDNYTIVLWSASPAPLTVLKQEPKSKNPVKR
jgi:hypothetical protein